MSQLEESLAKFVNETPKKNFRPNFPKLVLLKQDCSFDGGHPIEVFVCDYSLQLQEIVNNDEHGDLFGLIIDASQGLFKNVKEYDEDVYKFLWPTTHKLLSVADLATLKLDIKLCFVC